MVTHIEKMQTWHTLQTVTVYFYEVTYDVITHYKLTFSMPITE